jgi:hypothetical protein
MLCHVTTEIQKIELQKKGIQKHHMKQPHLHKEKITAKNDLYMLEHKELKLCAPETCELENQS